MSAYRYTLHRDVAPRLGDGTVCWVMLNPSTADETLDDPTIRRVKRFSADAGFRSLVVVNLFAIRATDPKVLADPDLDIIGPDNRPSIRRALSQAQAVVFAWGASIPQRVVRLARDQENFIRLCCEAYGLEPLCLGTTKNGHPRHPLYVAASERLRPFRRQSCGATS
jgi:hypothetical protein